MKRRESGSTAQVERETEFVQALQRGLSVIGAFRGDKPALTLGEVASETGLPRAAARRFLLTLADLGYVRIEGRLFQLTPRVLELGRAYLSSLRLPVVARPHLERLVDEVEESATVAVRDEADIVYVAHVPARRILAITIGVGSRDPAYATSLGRALLAGEDDEALDELVGSTRLRAMTPRTLADPKALRAELGRVRRQGFALVDQELEEGLRAIAAPIRDESGRVVAAVNLAVPASRWTVEGMQSDLQAPLVETAARIGADLAAPPDVVPRTDGASPVEVGEVAEREADFVQSLRRGLAVIRAFDGTSPSLTLSDVARRTSLARAAARRFLLTLVELGYMDVEGRNFRLGPRVLELGRPYLSSLTLPELALPHLRAFVGAARESSSIAVLDGDEIVYIAHVSARRILSVTVDVGSRDPAYATSLGRVLLAGEGPERTAALGKMDLRAVTARTTTDPVLLRAELERVGEQGFALVDQELEDELRALAAPIRDGHDRVIAAVNVSVHASRWTIGDILTQLLPKLLDTAAAIERDVRAGD